MVNPNKNKGDRAERAALAWLNDNGFSMAQRTRPGYQRDFGDIHLDPTVGLAPGCIAQVKDWGSDAWPAWLKGMEAQKQEAGAKHAVLIRKLRGHGNPGDWIAVMTLVHMTELLREAGYGEPTMADAAGRSEEPVSPADDQNHTNVISGAHRSAQPLSPDCRDGKHRACAGDAWDETTDQPADCGCDCHKEETK